MRKSTRDAVATALFLIVAPGAVVGLVPWLITGWREAPALLGFAPLRWLGMVLVGLCVLILLDSFWRFAREGLGSPAPVYPTERLVTTGLYRHVRNPMYVALVAGILGQALWLPSGALIIYAALVALAAHCSCASTRSRRSSARMARNTRPIAPPFRAGCRGSRPGAAMSRKAEGETPRGARRRPESRDGPRPLSPLRRRGGGQANDGSPHNCSLLPARLIRWSSASRCRRRRWC